ncbi:MAG: hydratase [Chloroflexi bacterium]|nr:hydratase [Chloroflexota bacterium]
MSTDALATELLDALDRNVLIQTPFTDRDPAFDNAQAYEVNAELFRRRVARGERPVGRKIGFTNRTIWPEYGVYTPMWAHMYDSTVREVGAGPCTQRIGRLAQPRIEPEILFHFRSAPSADASERELLASIDWVAHSIELVQSHFPDWKFKAADTAAAFGLHGALIYGPRHRIADLGDPDALVQALRTFRITLSKNGEAVAAGGGFNVLDSPLLALKHLLTVLRDQPQFEPVQAGEIVTTGTLTAAMPVQPGETWSTSFDGLGVTPLTVTFTT